jgi:hypothetical protein
MSKKVLHTKFGIAKVYRDYYRISTSKEGNYQEYLHRLIWKDFYKCEIPKGFVIHHKDGNKLNNCILNLQLMRSFDHLSIHHKGLTHSEESKLKMSKAKKGRFTGKDNWNHKDYYRVAKLGSPNRNRRYVIIKDKQIIKSSTNPLFLSEWFKQHYPNDKLVNDYEELGWVVVNYKLRPKGYLNGKRRYCIKHNGQVLKQSISKERLIEWFKENYPSEELDICND